MKVRLLASAVVLLFAGASWLVAAVWPVDAPPCWDNSEGLSEPAVVHKVAPSYPEVAREEGVTGVVLLDVMINRKGAVTDVEPVEDPDQRLTEAAMHAVRQWRFEPARRHDGTPVAVVYTVTVAFKLT